MLFMPMKKLKYFLLALTALFAVSASNAQIRNAVVGIGGLTCSACSYSTEKLIRQLSFIKDVKMDLNNHKAELIFKPGEAVDLEAVTKKISDAGFSVRNFFITVQFNNLRVSDGSCHEYDRMLLSFVGIKDQTVNGSTTLQLVGEKFMPKAAFKKYRGIMKPCSVKDPSRKNYFVTL